MTTLLQKALSRKRRPGNKVPVSQEDIDLSLAWVKGDVTLTQASYAMTGKISGNALYRVAVVLREAFRRGQITIKPKKS